MEVSILEESKDSIKFEIKGEDHTLANALRSELWNDPHVKIAGYNIDHPLIGVPVMIVDTDGKVEAKKAVLSAVDRLKKSNSDYLAQVKKL